MQTDRNEVMNGETADSLHSAPCALFLDQAGALGGAELSLFDIVRFYSGPRAVVLFEDGPFRHRLEAAGLSVCILRKPRMAFEVTRESTFIADLMAVPGILRLVVRVARIARAYDVLYANSQKAFIVAVLAGALSRRPVVWHLRDILSPEHFSRMHRRFPIWLANRMAARVIAISHAVADAFTENGGRSAKVRVIYNAVDLQPFKKVTFSQTEVLRRELGIEGRPTVGVFSRLAPWKGQHVLLEALAGLPGVHALLVGDALFHEKDYAADLRTRAAELGIADRVQFLGFRDDVPQLMSVCDAIVHTSTAPEPFGRVILEGMLSSRPVVATRAGGVLELIDSETTGVLVTPEDVGELQQALFDLLHDPQKAHRIGQAGRAAASERFSVTTLTCSIRMLLEEVVRPHGRRLRATVEDAMPPV